MAKLNTAPNIQDSDGFYAELLSLHEGRSAAQSEAINARLILILANHVGDRETLRQAFALALDSLNSSENADTGASKRGQS